MVCAHVMVAVIYSLPSAHIAARAATMPVPPQRFQGRINQDSIHNYHSVHPVNPKLTASHGGSAQNYERHHTTSNTIHSAMRQHLQVYMICIEHSMLAGTCTMQWYPVVIKCPDSVLPQQPPHTANITVGNAACDCQK
jgi:hypothetical protein